MALEVRPLTADEGTELRRRAGARPLPARVGERAKMILRLREGQRVPAVAKQLGVGADVESTPLFRQPLHSPTGGRTYPVRAVR